MSGWSLSDGAPAFFVSEVNVSNYPSLAMRTECAPKGDTTIDCHVVVPLFGGFNAALSIGSAFDDLKRKIFYGQNKDMTAVMQKLGDWHYEMPAKDLVLKPEQYRMLHAAMGLVTEAIEFLETVVNNVKDGVPFDPVNLMEENGDTFWYSAIPMNLFGHTIEQALAANIAKLKKRYPDKFNLDAAVNRDLKAERSVLEQHASKLS